MKRIFLFLAIFAVSTSAHAETCTYDTWDWDTIKKASVNRRTVSKDRNSLDRTERGEIAGCTVCREVQVTIRIEGLPPFEMCRKFADRAKRAVESAKDSGFKFVSIVGYRVGKSKGPIDSKGLRTEFSNHSYGVAVDFNSETNGLYDDCLAFSPRCKLLRGGPYDPRSKLAITAGSPLHRAMLVEGFKWGGEIAAKQKDFMHFSPTGM